MFLTEVQKGRFADYLSRIPSRELMGEVIEKILADVLPNAHQLPKDKKWFDIVQPTRALEVKTFVTGPPLRVNSTLYNVLKRVSKVTTKNSRGNLRAPQDVGNELIDYLHETIQEHAAEKKVPKKHVLAVLFRTPDARNYAYWEEPLHFGLKLDYRWGWNRNETLTGHRGSEMIFNWYSRNQKQLFYRWKVPAGADFFTVVPISTVTLTEQELEAQRKKWYLKGFENGKAASSVKG